jgi:LmbE family N-acetylglucosaminyl deacetylase
VKRFALVADIFQINFSWTDFLRDNLSSLTFLASKLLACVLLILCFFVAPGGNAQFPPAPGTGPGLPETIEAIDSARVTTRILYITAHPDDESAAALTYLARGLHADVALLSLTRGEGGQNALGPEQAPQLGLIRTQELLAATRGYGVKLYFTRAKDFGYSKTPEETEKIWGDAVLEDMVRVIREFRPNIVINGWGGVHTGHGHHQLSGIWTPKAVKLAADPDYFRDGVVPIWDAYGAGVQILDLERGSDNPKGYLLPVDEVSSLYGKSWREIGLDAFTNHRTQGIAGFLNSPFLRRPLALIPEDGSKFDPTYLAVNLTNSSYVKGPCACETELKEVDRSLQLAHAAALQLDWPSTVASIVSAQKYFQKIALFPIPSPTPPDVAAKVFFTRDETQKLDRALELAAGIQISAESNRADVALNDDFAVTLRFRCRAEISCNFGDAQLFSHSLNVQATKDSAESSTTRWKVKLERNDQKPPAYLQFAKFDPLIRPEPVPILSASQKLQLSDFSFASSVPVSNVTATSTSVVRIPLHLVPAYTLAVEPSQVIEVLGQPRMSSDVFLRVHSYSTKPAKITVGLDVPDGLQSGAPVEVHFDGIGDHYAKLTITPRAKLEHGDYTITAYAKRGEEKFSTSLEPLSTMPTILWSEPAQTVVHAFDINIPANLRVGYISAEGEMIPDALKHVGINVEMLDASALTFGDLSRFHTIIVGVRAYELRPELPSANRRLLDFVSAGGTLVVQYNRDGIWDKLLPAPYPATIGSPTPRTTDENAAVTFLQPDDPLLNTPNKITAADFQNWVQERGLYYWSQFDSRYTPLLSMHDPGEKDLKGALVYVHYGKGMYIYTGLAFFRELPEGVPGAYRLFVNLLAAGSPSGNRTQ